MSDVDADSYRRGIPSNKVNDPTWAQGLPPIVRKCEQRCGAAATVYAMGSAAGDWGGYYCEPCANELGFIVTDRLKGVGP